MNRTLTLTVSTAEGHGVVGLCADVHLRRITGASLECGGIVGVLLGFRMRTEAGRLIKRQEIPVLWAQQWPWRRILKML